MLVLLKGSWVTIWASVCIIIGGAFGAMILGVLKLKMSEPTARAESVG